MLEDAAATGGEKMVTVVEPCSHGDMVEPCSHGNGTSVHPQSRMVVS